MQRKVTATLLRRKGACKKPVERFADIFPKGAVLTKDNLETAFRTLGHYWLVGRLPVSPKTKLKWYDAIETYKMS